MDPRACSLWIHPCSRGRVAQPISYERRTGRGVGSRPSMGDGASHSPSLSAGTLLHRCPSLQLLLRNTLMQHTHAMFCALCARHAMTWRRPHAAASGLASRGADRSARQRRAPKLAAVRLLPLEPPEQVELKHVSFQDVLWIHKRWGMGYGSTSDHRSVELERACAYVGPDGRPPRQLVMQADGRGPSVALHTMSAACWRG